MQSLFVFEEKNVVTIWEKNCAFSLHYWVASLVLNFVHDIWTFLQTVLMVLSKRNTGQDHYLGYTVIVSSDQLSLRNQYYL